MPLDPQRFIEIFRIAALQAGSVASRLQGEVRTQRKTNETSPESQALTAVDLATQDVVLHLLHALLTKETDAPIALDAEEETDTVALFAPEAPGRDLVVLDPVDGTLSYTRGSRDYAVMGALLQDGRYAASLIHFPAHRVTAWAIRGSGCFRELEGRKPARILRPRAPSRILVTPRTDRKSRDRLASLASEIEISRCSAVDASAPALGRARAALSPKRSDRRRAIGYLLTLEAGGHVQMGDHDWRGEDPDALGEDAAPSIVASSRTLARRVSKAYETGGSSIV